MENEEVVVEVEGEVVVGHQEEVEKEAGVEEEEVVVGQ